MNNWFYDGKKIIDIFLHVYTNKSVMVQTNVHLWYITNDFVGFCCCFFYITHKFPHCITVTLKPMKQNIFILNLQWCVWKMLNIIRAYWCNYNMPCFPKETKKEKWVLRRKSFGVNILFNFFIYKVDRRQLSNVKKMKRQF